MLLFCSVCGTSLSVEEGSASLEFKCQGCGYTLPISKPVSSNTVDEVFLFSLLGN